MDEGELKSIAKTCIAKEFITCDEWLQLVESKDKGDLPPSPFTSWDELIDYENVGPVPSSSQEEGES